MFEIVLYVLALSFLGYSFTKDRQKTRIALIKAWKSLVAILPTFAGVIALIGLVLAVLSPELISKAVGENTGFWGMLLTSVIGAVTLIPAFIAYPMAGSILNSGAGIMQITVFVSTLTMVGTVTAPLEAKYFGWKETLLRNGFSYIFCFVAAIIMGVLLT